MIVLPWPAKELSPNSRCHWAAKAKATKAARSWACLATKEAKERVGKTGKIHLHVYFYPPDNRKRDETNMLDSLKAHFDGIADALGVDDVRFTVSYEVCKPIRHGSVRIIVTG